MRGGEVIGRALMGGLLHARWTVSSGWEMGLASGARSLFSSRGVVQVLMIGR